MTSKRREMYWAIFTFTLIFPEGILPNHWCGWMEGKNGDSRSSSLTGLRSEFKAARVAGTRREHDGEDVMRQLLFKLLADSSAEQTARTPGNPAENSSWEAKELNRFELLHNGEETEAHVPLR